MSKILKNKKSGETLIETLISMFFISIFLVPLSDLLIKLNNTNIKIDNQNKEYYENKNLVEILKIMPYEKIINYIGENKIKNIDSFYNNFSIENKYRIIDKIEKEKNIIIRQTAYYYINENNKKEYVFEININNLKEFYFPIIFE